MLRVAKVLSGTYPGIVKMYLPTNYKLYTCDDDMLIAGKDVAGWTLDGYVIPRLASANIVAKEIS